MSKGVLSKIHGAFQSLGIELKKSHSLYEFEYEHTLMLLSVGTKDQSIVFLTYVVDSGDMSVDKNMLEMALDVVSGFHKDYYGDWNEGVPYFASPCYSLKGIKEVKADWLQAELKAFFDAYMFLEANIHILCDHSIFGMTQDSAVINGLMSTEEVEKMILKDYIANTGLICIEAGDIKAIRENSDFIDGGKKICYAKDMKENLVSSLDELQKVHIGKRLVGLAVKFLFNKESELMMEEMSAMNEVFDSLKDVEVVWGIGKNDKPRNGKIAICIVAGFKNS